MINKGQYYDKKTRYRHIDFIKGICILFVIFTHYAWTEDQCLKMLFPFWIDMSVPIFMIISGFCFSKSFLKSDIDTLRQCYQFKTIIKRLIRFTIPYVIFFAIEQLSLFLFSVQDITVKYLIKSFLTGAIGPGSYYYPILLQFVFVFPIMYYVINKFDYKGLLGCIVFNFIYELVKFNLFINEDLYRLLILRYTTVIAFGCYFAISKKRIKIGISIILSLIGIVYIIVYRYFAVTPFIMTYWTGTSMMACLYVIPITAVLIKSQNLKFTPIELLGKASYNIFLVQMSYYAIFSDLLYRVIENICLRILVSFLICILAGVGFYYFETPLTKRILKVIKVM